MGSVPSFFIPNNLSRPASGILIRFRNVRLGLIVEDITALEALVLVMRNGRVLVSRLPGVEADTR